MPVLPSLNKISSEFGWRIHPITQKRTHHSGTDFSWSGPSKFDIIAPFNGKIESYGNAGGYGNLMIISTMISGNRVEARLAHLNESVHELGNVSVGSLVAIMGSTGNSTGTHLHFEILVNGSRVDPIEWLNTQNLSIATSSETKIEEDEMPDYTRVEPRVISDGKALYYAIQGSKMIHISSPSDKAVMTKFYSGETGYNLPEVQTIEKYLKQFTPIVKAN